MMKLFSDSHMGPLRISYTKQCPRRKLFAPAHLFSARSDLSGCPNGQCNGHYDPHRGDQSVEV